MRTVTRGFSGMLSLVFLLGGMTLLTLPGHEAEASGEVTHKDLHQDHKKLGEWLEKIEEQLGDAAPPCGAGTAGQRFVVSTDGTEVCDNTTGWTWEQTPDSIERTHADALAHCPTVGPGYGLPEVKALISLVDYSQFDPALPAGHPFSIVQSSFFWSAALADDSEVAWNVEFHGGLVLVDGKAASHLVWCVRSGS